MKIAPNAQCPYIVIIGAWNPKIFTPFWIKSQGITNSEEIVVELTFGSSDYKFLMKFDGISLSISDTNFILKLAEWDENLLPKLEEIALIILDRLRHTPLKAIGCNFDFTVSEPTPDFLNLFKVPSQTALNSLGYPASALNITHKISIPDIAEEVSIKLFDTGKGYQANLNFQKLTGKAEEASSWIQGNIPKFYDNSLKILGAFDLKLEEEYYE